LTPFNPFFNFIDTLLALPGLDPVVAVSDMSHNEDISLCLLWVLLSMMPGFFDPTFTLPFLYIAMGPPFACHRPRLDGVAGG
jgi:hypothetical protein